MTPSGEHFGRSVRPIEESVRTDLAGAMSYGRCLDVDRLLGAQHPVSELGIMTTCCLSPAPDE